MIRYVALFAWIGCFALSASAQTFEWPRSTPAQVNVSEAGLSALENELRSGTYGQVTSFLLLRHGKVAFERYFRGHTEQSEMPLYSVTKSWASALMGVAVAQGTHDDSLIQRAFHDPEIRFAGRIDQTAACPVGDQLDVSLGVPDGPGP